jgi:hypothetical protein
LKAEQAVILAEILMVDRGGLAVADPQRPRQASSEELPATLFAEPGSQVGWPSGAYAVVTELERVTPKLTRRRALTAGGAL